MNSDCHETQMSTSVGRTGFMADMKEALTAFGVAPERIHIEIFNGGESRTPGVVGATARAPHPPS